MIIWSGKYKWIFSAILLFRLPSSDPKKTVIRLLPNSYTLVGRCWGRIRKALHLTTYTKPKTHDQITLILKYKMIQVYLSASKELVVSTPQFKRYCPCSLGTLRVHALRAFRLANFNRTISGGAPATLIYDAISLVMPSCYLPYYHTTFLRDCFFTFLQIYNWHTSRFSSGKDSKNQHFIVIWLRLRSLVFFFSIHLEKDPINDT